MSNYAKIHSLDVSNGEGIGVAIFFSGCDFHCKNCFNKELWNYDYGKPFSTDTIKTIKNLINKPYITRLSILGGDALMGRNLIPVLNLLREIKQEKSLYNKKIWLYTGYRFEEIYDKAIYFAQYRLMSSITNEMKNEMIRFSILENIDVLVDGQYIDELKDISLKFRGSSNQRIINVKKSLEENQVVLYIK